MIAIDMTSKIEQRITDKHFSVENDILTLKVNLGDYSLTDKQVTAVFNVIETAPLTSAVVEGDSIVDIPVYASYISEGINYVQLYFRWDTAKVETSSVMIWRIDKSVLAETTGVEEQDLMSYYLGVVAEVETKLVNGELDGADGTDGTDGTDGATWLSGTVDPTTEGADGDYYLNTASYDVFKKAAGSWGTALLNIKGLKGDTGDSTKGISLYVDGELEVDTNLLSVLSPLGLTITGVRASVDVAPTDASLIIDINKNGTTLYTTQANRPTITTGTTSVTATLPDVTSISLGDKISIDIDQVGSTLQGENLSILLICEVV